MKLLPVAIICFAVPLMAAPIEVSCPHPKDLALSNSPTLQYATNSGWQGETTLTKATWFFNGTSPVTTDKKGNAILECRYGNRGDTLILQMTQVSTCTQNTCTEIKGKGSGNVMLAACTYSCGT